MEKSNTSQQPAPNPPSHEHSPLSVIDWLAYGLGSFLIIGNVYKIPLLLAYLNQFLFKSALCTGVEPGRISSSCIPIGTTFIELTVIVLPEILVLMGVLIIWLKRKYLAQIVAALLFAELVLHYGPYFGQGAVGSAYSSESWFLLFQPIFQVPLIQLILAIVCSRYLKEPSVFTRLETPAFMSSARPIVWRWRKVIAAALISSLILWVGAVEVKNLNLATQDKHTADSIGPVAQKIYTSISTTSPHSWAEASSWITTTQKLAKSSKLNFHGGTKQFQLCANFLTDQTYGMKVKSPLTAADITRHPEGSACFNYPVSDQQRLKKDYQVSNHMLVVGLRSLPGSQHLTVQTIPLDPGGTGDAANDIDITIAPVYHSDGTIAQPSEVRLGETVEVHYQMNLLTASQSVYKVVISDPSVNPNYCNIIVLDSAYFPTANPICPATVNNLILESLDAQSLSARTVRNGEVVMEWPLTAPPDSYDRNGTKVALTDLQTGETVNLIFSGTKLAAIREIAN